MFYSIENIPESQIAQAVVARLLPLVPFHRREKALRYKHLQGQYTCLRSWQLLHELLITHGYVPADLPLAGLTATEDDYGKPWLDCSTPDQPVYFSLSHTKNAVAVAIDHSPVGIDVETIVSPERIADAHFLERTMCAAEQQRISAANIPCAVFTELWTRKEALVKARGTGLTDLNALPDLLKTTEPFLIFSNYNKDYAYAIAHL